MQGMPARAHDAMQLPQHADLILHVLQHLLRDNEVQTVVLERQPADSRSIGDKEAGAIHWITEIQTVVDIIPIDVRVPLIEQRIYRTTRAATKIQNAGILG